MTYCVAMCLDEGLVCLSDSRTNAGVDHINTFRKMTVFERAGDRVLVLMSAGNLAITQAVISLLQEHIDKPKEGIDTLLTADSMFRVAEIVGDAMREIQQRYGTNIAQMGESTISSIIVGGQRAGGGMRLFHIYSAGNFIEAGEDTPYFQIGEHKYGKPILDRVIGVDTPVDVCVTAALLSMDSTIRSNLSVGMPLDLAVINANQLCFARQVRIEDHDPNYLALSEAWSNALRNAFQDMNQITVV